MILLFSVQVYADDSEIYREVFQDAMQESQQEADSLFGDDADLMEVYYDGVRDRLLEAIDENIFVDEIQANAMLDSLDLDSTKVSRITPEEVTAEPFKIKLKVLEHPTKEDLSVKVRIIATGNSKILMQYGVSITNADRETPEIYRDIIQKRNDYKTITIEAGKEEKEVEFEIGELLSAYPDLKFVFLIYPENVVKHSKIKKEEIKIKNPFKEYNFINPARTSGKIIWAIVLIAIALLVFRKKVAGAAKKVFKRTPKLKTDFPLTASIVGRIAYYIRAKEHYIAVLQQAVTKEGSDYDQLRKAHVKHVCALVHGIETMFEKARWGSFLDKVKEMDGNKAKVEAWVKGMHKDMTAEFGNTHVDTIINAIHKIPMKDVEELLSDKYKKASAKDRFEMLYEHMKGNIKNSDFLAGLPESEQEKFKHQKEIILHLVKVLKNITLDDVIALVKRLHDIVKEKESEVEELLKDVKNMEDAQFKLFMKAVHDNNMDSVHKHLETEIPKKTSE